MKATQAKNITNKNIDTSLFQQRMAYLYKRINNQAEKGLFHLEYDLLDDEIKELRANGYTVHANDNPTIKTPTRHFITWL